MIDELAYRSYCCNRKLFPTTTPERWAKIYGDTAAMEERRQDELMKAALGGFPDVNTQRAYYAGNE